MKREPLTVRSRRVEGAPVVAVRAWLEGGSRSERQPGQALVAGRLLAEGSTLRGWREIAEAAEGRGMSVTSFGDLELTGVSIDALAADWELAIDWAAELVLTPAFPGERCAWAVRQAQGELASIADHPEASTHWAFLEQLYAPHPAGRPPQGSASSLAAVEPDDCRGFHERALGTGLVVSVAGLIDPAAVERRVRERFTPVGSSAGAFEPPPAPGGTEGRRVWPVSGDQAHLFLGKLTVPRAHPALAPLRLLSVILGAGGGLSGRIPQRLREREGLAYAAHVDAAAGAGLDPGRFAIYVGTSVATVEQAIASARQELERLLADGITDAELEEARSYLLGREPFRRETARQWAELMAAAVHYDLPLDSPEWVSERLRTVNREEVEAAARQFLDPAELKITVGTPAP